MGNVVTQIACGRFHTLALVPKTGRLFAFGQGANAQLGMGDTTNRLLPCPIKGNYHFMILYVFFLTVSL